MKINIKIIKILRRGEQSQYKDKFWSFGGIAISQITLKSSHLFGTNDFKYRHSGFKNTRRIVLPLSSQRDEILTLPLGADNEFNKLIAACSRV
jgi:hypothetical protein